MKPKTLLLILLFLLPFAAAAQEETSGKPEVKFAYDVNFDFYFNNMEFDKTELMNSGTVVGARLTPSVGINLYQPEADANHRLMIGMDIKKNFGASPVSFNIGASELESSSKLNTWALFEEISFYYNLNKKFGSTDLLLYAGIFPRRFASPTYSEAFISDHLKFHDNNLEGFMIQIHRPKFKWEIGLDWYGQRGNVRKEKFSIFSSASGQLTPWLKLSYDAYMCHFAGSERAEGVVDNILFNPYLIFNIAEYLNFQDFSLRTGWLQSFQRDRLVDEEFKLPGGFEFDFNIMRWNFGIRNYLYIGKDLMPYYKSSDAAGDVYGDRLYWGNPLYRMDDHNVSADGSGSDQVKIYDRLDAYYSYSLSKWLAVAVLARFNFHSSGYSGCQQIIAVTFNLEQLLSRPSTTSK